MFGRSLTHAHTSAPLAHSSEPLWVLHHGDEFETGEEKL